MSFPNIFVGDLKILCHFEAAGESANKTADPSFGGKSRFLSPEIRRKNHSGSNSCKQFTAQTGVNYALI